MMLRSEVEVLSWDPDTISREVVETAREALIIGTA